MHRRSAPHERRDSPRAAAIRAAGSRSTRTPRQGWSLEHIHAQNSQGLDEGEASAETGSRAHVKKIRDTDWTCGTAARRPTRWRRRSTPTLRSPRARPTTSGFESILDKVFALFRRTGAGTARTEDMHGLGNLALLQTRLQQQAEQRGLRPQARTDHRARRGRGLHPALHPQRVPEVLHSDAPTSSSPSGGRRTRSLLRRS